MQLDAPVVLLFQLQHSPVGVADPRRTFIVSVSSDAAVLCAVTAKGQAVCWLARYSDGAVSPDSGWLEVKVDKWVGSKVDAVTASSNFGLLAEEKCTAAALVSMVRARARCLLRGRDCVRESLSRHR